MPIKSQQKSRVKLPAINPDKQALADFRAQIDRLDIALHDLLRERAEVVDQIKRIKGKQTLPIRPGREAQIIRSLMARPQGRLPEGLVVRLWREILAAFAAQQSLFKVAVYAPSKGDDLWDQARDHYGAFMPLVEAPTASAAIKMLMADKVSIAVVPPPAANEKDIWWPLLIGEGKSVFTVFAALPFESLKPGRSNARHVAPTGFAVGKLYPELTGDDHSLLALQCVYVPEAEMRRLLGKAGYKVRQLLVQMAGRSGSAPTSFWVEVDGYVGRSDTRLSRLRAMLGSRLRHLVPMGGYAVPLKMGKR
jgi:chorismate mutase / prephenate dehydratase